MDKISRREFIRVSAIAAAGIAAAACQQAEPTTAPEVEPTKAPEKQEEPTATPVPVVEEAAKEAPMLADMVAAGDLPPMVLAMPQGDIRVASSGFAGACAQLFSALLTARR